MFLELFYNLFSLFDQMNKLFKLEKYVLKFLRRLISLKSLIYLGLQVPGFSPLITCSNSI